MAHQLMTHEGPVRENKKTLTEYVIVFMFEVRAHGVYSETIRMETS